MTTNLNSLLHKSKSILGNLHSFMKVYIVMGNESCDLDSTVSSLVYSLLVQQNSFPGMIAFPLMNVKEHDFPCKTEVDFFCRFCGVETEHFIFRDQVDLKSLQDAGILELILVDHHTLPAKDEYLRRSVVQVIDHRPRDPVSLWSTNTDLCIETVGSCCTLIARKVLSSVPSLVTPPIAQLLCGTIILDTACLNPSADIAKPLDIDIVRKLLEIEPINVELMFQRINEAKSDISKLTTRQIIIKDLKVVAGIPIIGLPILIHDFLQMPEAPESVVSFCNENGYKLAVIMGLNVSHPNIQREVCVYWSAPHVEALSVQVVNKLQANNFGLEEMSVPTLSRQFKLFLQTNIKLSRKKLLPIVQEVAERFSQYL